MSTSPGPSRASIVLILAAAAVIGFLGGALIAATSGDSRSDTRTAEPTRPPATPTSTPEPTSSPLPTDDAATLTLTADRAEAATNEIINLAGVLTPAAESVTLQVQQSVNGLPFTDFPVTIETRADGSYKVRVRTRREGTNQFRMVTAVDGEAIESNPVTVVIG